jgi:hypothetical protein
MNEMSLQGRLLTSAQRLGDDSNKLLVRIAVHMPGKVSGVWPVPTLLHAHLAPVQFPRH